MRVDRKYRLMRDQAKKKEDTCSTLCLFYKITKQENGTNDSGQLDSGGLLSSAHEVPYAELIFSSPSLLGSLCSPELSDLVVGRSQRRRHSLASSVGITEETLPKITGAHHLPAALARSQ
jgi:hypothetical protein